MIQRRRCQRFLLAALPLLVVADVPAAGASYAPTELKPPAVQREFRGVWLASVKNIDWPSKPGLSSAQQKAELIILLDRAKQLRLNAVLLQIRPSCDALYASTIEPWSEYLTGQMGRAPEPYYDPLSFAVDEAHKRGLELHAWFNPYRARHAAAISTASANHISKTKPHLVRNYGKSLWLDPGEREVQEHSLGVVMDVVRRYDIDGVHFDDYFYPYPEKDAQGRVLPFPDWAEWKRYQNGGGKLGRSDWRRENVNLFMVRVSQSIRSVKPWVKFGIAPFGIWRPGFPAQIKGLDAYEVLYADSRKWLREGWVDYLAPQLYWGDDSQTTSFTALLHWWVGENVHHRHVWPGLDISRVGPGRAPEEIISQVKRTREQSGADGNILWGVRALSENRRGLSDSLAREGYDQPALIPNFPWIDRQPPSPPSVSAAFDSIGGVVVTCQPTGGESVWQWLVQTRNGGAWLSEVLPGTQMATRFLLRNPPEAVAVRAVDRCGNMSPAVVLEKRIAPEAAVSP
jgi:uncharacterized lipoprotein YddW (UPF0748 family)